MLNNDRVKECFWLFSFTLPLGEEYRKKCVATFGEDLTKYLPQVFRNIQDVCLQYPEDFEGYLDLIFNMIKYMKNESDINPANYIDCDPEKLKQYMEIELGKYKKSKTD